MLTFYFSRDHERRYVVDTRVAGQVRAYSISVASSADEIWTRGFIAADTAEELSTEAWRNVQAQGVVLDASEN